MTSPLDRGWGDPRTPGYERDHIVTIHAAGISLRVHHELAKIFAYYVEEVGRHYPLDPTADDWGFVAPPRPIRGREDEYAQDHDPRWLSLHDWGLAVDLNSQRNPMSTDPHAQHQFQAPILDPILVHFRGRMVWGGHWRTRQDYMHTEWDGTLRDAQVITRQMGL